MDKKATLIIVLIAIVIILFGFMYFNQGSDSHANSIKVGNSYFVLPDGYSEGIPENGNTNITNGTNSIIIIEYNGSNIQKYIDKYKQFNENRSYTTKISKLTVNGTEIYKSSISNNTKTSHYWFVNNNKVYEISTSNGNDQTGKIITELIKSSVNNS